MNNIFLQLIDADNSLLTDATVIIVWTVHADRVQVCVRRPSCTSTHHTFSRWVRHVTEHAVIRFDGVGQL